MLIVLLVKKIWFQLNKLFPNVRIICVMLIVFKGSVVAAILEGVNGQQ